MTAEILKGVLEYHLAFAFNERGVVRSHNTLSVSREVSSYNCIYIPILPSRMAIDPHLTPLAHEHSGTHEIPTT